MFKKSHRIISFLNFHFYSQNNLLVRYCAINAKSAYQLIPGKCGKKTKIIPYKKKVDNLVNSFDIIFVEF